MDKMHDGVYGLTLKKSTTEGVIKLLIKESMIDITQVCSMCLDTICKLLRFSHGCKQCHKS